MIKFRRSNLMPAVVFLLPNLLGFLAFVLFPLAASFGGSFTDWSLRPAQEVRFVGLENYRSILSDPDFYFYLYNTFYLMLGLPVCVGGALFLALLLSRPLAIDRKSREKWGLASVAIVACGTAALLWMLGRPNAAIILAVLGALVALGLRFDSLAYRTVCHLPHFTAGAATILLWTQLLNPNFGLVNSVIERAADWLSFPVQLPGWVASSESLLGFLPLPESFNSTGFGLGARESIMLMGIWVSIGGNTMLLYLAAIMNIPEELHEAATIDGAGFWQEFRYVIWPQLRPTTFFVLVMGVIHALQGGFEQARLMTEGGPAGSTTTLSYYIYQLGFERLELGYGSAVSWLLFLLIFCVTAIGWRSGKGGAAE